MPVPQRREMNDIFSSRWKKNDLETEYTRYKHILRQFSICGGARTENEQCKDFTRHTHALYLQRSFLLHDNPVLTLTNAYNTLKRTQP